jgi:hypothetical protein
MKSIEELREFYDTSLKTRLAEFERQRQSIVKKSLIALGIIIAVGLIIGWVLINKGLPPIIFLFVLVGAIVVWAGIANSYKGEYRWGFKYIIIQKLIAFIEPGLEYRPQDGLPKALFEVSGLFRQQIDRYRSEDMFEGKSGKTQVSFSEVHAEYKTTTHTRKGGTQTHWHTIFKGLYFTADFNKKCHGRTIVLPDTAEKVFGSFGQTLQSWCASAGQLVRLEDPEFEKEFVVYGTDQIEARYILSTSLMERILAFRHKAAADIYLSFLGSKVFVAISMQKDLFEPKMFSSALEFDTVAEYYDQLSLALGIVDDLNLNTRIWSKE